VESKHRSIAAGAGIFLAAIGFRPAVPAASAAEKAARIIDYNRDIRPIFSQNCYACHGPDAGKRKAGLRLDVKESAFKKLESGKVAIVARNPKQSELIRLITTTDEDDKMPPAKSGKHLTAAQIDLLSNRGTMSDNENCISRIPRCTPWNRGKLLGIKLPVCSKNVSSIRTRLLIEGRIYNFAMFDRWQSAPYGRKCSK